MISRQYSKRKQVDLGSELRVDEVSMRRMRLM